MTDNAPTSKLTQAELKRRILKQPKPSMDIDKRAFSLIIPEGQVFEIRVLDAKSSGAPYTASGYFNRIDSAIDAISALPESKGVYYTLNPVLPELLSRRANRIDRCSKSDATTGNHEIQKRTRMLFDIDPDRPTGISASESQKQIAIETAKAIMDGLSKDGWPDPVVCDSGNGIQLIYAIDLPCDDSGMVESVTKAVAERFDAPGAHVDLSVHNAARICRMPGTWNRKGDSTEDRPHRIASILKAPDSLVPVPVELLQKAIGVKIKQSSKTAQSAQKSKPTGKKKKGWTLDSVVSFFNENFPECGLEEPEPYKDGHRLKMQVCPFDQSHVNSASLFFSEDHGAGFACLHNSCKDRNWKSLRMARIAKAEKSGEIILDRMNHYGAAKKFINHYYTESGETTLIHYDSSFREYTGSHYEERDKDSIRSLLWHFQDIAKVETKEGFVPFNPNTNTINNALDAIKALSNCSLQCSPPAWLRPQDHDIPASEIIAFRNTLMHLSSGSHIEHTSDLFITSSLPFAYDPEAECPQWYEFLYKLWPNDQESIDVLQMIFGYLITSETRLQKIFAFIGPKRSGKGTIARILDSLLGADSVCNPTLTSLATNFGLQSMIGKRLATISDARLSGKADQAPIVERLLCISGEDNVTVQRKYLGDWTGKLDSRILLLSNELPRLSDSSGALASRFVMLIFKNSFLNREDLFLTDKLKTELPGIANWAIEGWKKLQKIGRIYSPKSAEDCMSDLNDISSPISAFVKECCVVEDGLSICRKELYKAWCDWCESEGRDHPGTLNNFGKDLHSCVPGITKIHKRVPSLAGSGRERHYCGIDLLSSGTHGTHTEHTAEHTKKSHNYLSVSTLHQLEHMEHTKTKKYIELEKSDKNEKNIEKTASGNNNRDLCVPCVPVKDDQLSHVYDDDDDLLPDEVPF